jgi:MoxR-like ATPase
MNPTDDVAAAAELKAGYDRIRAEMAKVIVGQDAVLDQLIVALFARGHCMLTGVPGLAKTLMISSLARTLELGFKRVQFTPDLMPTDITGTEIIQENRTTGQRELVFIEGPVFTNVLLADEINRTPPRTQAALLEAMQDRQVTTGGQRRALPDPFFVLATQNPIEQEGTYPLPEAQLDRFMFNVTVDYPTEGDEREILRRTTQAEPVDLPAVMSGEEILKLQALVRRVPVADDMLSYATALVRATRPDSPDAPQGALPRLDRGHPARRAPGAAPPHPDQLLGPGRGHPFRRHHRPAAAGRPRPPHPGAQRWRTPQGRRLARTLSPGAACPRGRARPVASGPIRALPSASRTSRSRRPVPWRASWRAGTGARTAASAWSSWSVAPTCRATTCATSTGAPSRATTAWPSSATRRRPTSSARWSWTPARRWPTRPAAGRPSTTRPAWSRPPSRSSCCASATARPSRSSTRIWTA